MLLMNMVVPAPFGDATAGPGKGLQYQTQFGCYQEVECFLV
jgi:hypothetical protein